jgi:Zn finger protein HypA/HybF involved in hydrogenase expression
LRVSFFIGALHHKEWQQMTYQEQIRHPKWQKKRLEVLKANKFRCQDCGNKEQELHVHHPFYRKGAMIWEYKVDELESLCHKCHKERHDITDKINKALATCKKLPLVLAYIQGLNGAVDPAPKKAIEPEKAVHTGAVVRKRRVPEPEEGTIPVSEEEAEKTAETFFEKMKALMG